LFATFDPPPASTKDAIGHYCLVTLNLLAKRFEFLDSINSPESGAGSPVFRKMVKNIKKVWKDGSASCDEPLNPPTLDGFVMSHVNVPQQGNGFALILIFFFAHIELYALLYENTEAFLQFERTALTYASLAVQPPYCFFFLFLYSEYHNFV